MKSKPAKSPLQISIKSEASASTAIQRHALLAAVSLMSLSVGAAHAQAVNTSPDNATTTSNQYKPGSVPMPAGSNQLKVTSAQNKLTSDQHKLTSTQTKLTTDQQKLTSTQNKLTTDQQKLTSTQNKLTSVQQKQTSTQIKASFDLSKQVPSPATGGTAPPK